MTPKAFQPPRFADAQPAAAAGGNAPGGLQSTPDQEALIQAITERVVAMLNRRL